MIKLELLFFSLFGSLIINAQSSGFDDFFSLNPLDFQFGTHIVNYEIITDQNQVDKGISGNIAGGLGWRYTLLSGKNYSIAPRLGFSLGYLQNNNNANLTIQIPLTLNLALGAGSTIDSNSKFGVSFGGGYSSNTFLIDKEIDEVIYFTSNSYLAPIVYASFNFKYNKSILGVQPSLSWKDNDVFIGLHLIGHILY